MNAGRHVARRFGAAMIDLALLLPIALCAFILVTAPDYMNVLLHETNGRWVLASAAALQVAGYLIMRRIAQIKV